MKQMKTLMDRYCLISYQFCYCMSVKVGTIIIAFLGLLPSMCYIMMLIVGDDLFKLYGVPDDLATVLIHIYAAGGVLMAAMHIILIVAAFTYNEKLILMYLWFCVMYCFVDVTLGLIVSIMAIINDSWFVGLALILTGTFYWTVLYYYVFPVINGFRRSITTVVIILA